MKQAKTNFKTISWNSFLFRIFLTCLFPFSVFGQNDELQNFKIICYNVENYFDTVDDSLTNDAEYLPGGMRGWNNTKYKAKQANIGKVITAIGGWDAPALVGLCEVETNKCLTDLTRYSGLQSLAYEFVHYDSPDARGVDVALLYQPSQFKPFHSKPIRIDFPNIPDYKTRDVLLVSGVVPSDDTLHVFVCHLPSRLGGELESEERRLFVAGVIRTHVDSLFASSPASNILIMGDFNDYPVNRSITQKLKALSPVKDEISSQELYNLALPLHLSGKGTYKYAGEWGMLDQIIVSGNLLNAGNNFYTRSTDIHVFEADFLLEDDVANLGRKPFRTYTGMKYNGGFSDHLPVYVDFRIKKKE